MRTSLIARSSIGFSFVWILFSRSLYKAAIGYAIGAEEDAALFYAEYMLVLALVGIAMAVLHAKTDAFVAGHSKVLELGLPSANLVVFFLLWMLGPVMDFRYGLIALLLTAGLSTAFLVIGWARMFQVMDNRMCMLAVLLSWPVSSVFSLMTFYAGFVAPLLAACAPLVSGILLRTCTTSQPEAEPNDDQPRLLKALPFPLVVLLLVFLVVADLIRKFMAIAGLSDGSTALYTQMLCTVISCVLAIAAAIIIRLTSQPRSSLQNSNSLWTSSAIILIGGLLLVIVIDSDWSFASLGVVMAGRRCLELFFWLLLLSGVQNGLSPSLVFGSLYLPFKGLAECISFPLTSGQVALAVRFDDSLVAGFVAFIVFALVATTLLFQNRQILRASRAEQVIESDVISRINERTALIQRTAAEAGLTKRESEVALLVVQGYTVKRIAEILFISTSTVQGHMKRIYRALDIHSRQEFIDLIDGKQEESR